MVDELHSQYASGAEMPAGLIVGSTLGASGLNPVVDRLNKIHTSGTVGGVWSMPGAGFTSDNPDVDDIDIDANGFFNITAGTPNVHVPVNLPNGVNVTSAIVTGDVDAQASTWTLQNIDLNGGGRQTLGTANVDTEDTTIAAGPGSINNNTFAYWFEITGNDAGDTFFGAQIKYTG